MKTLSNISPFILLLVPVFVMMLLTFTTNVSGTHQTEEMASKSSVKSVSMVKVSAVFSK